jgi:hypothetical protein
MCKTELLALCLASAGLFTPSAFAKCEAGSKTLFACTTAKGKLIEVCDAGKTIGYSLGKRGAKPDVAFKVPRERVTTYQWKGIGRTISYSVDISHGDNTYSIYENSDKMVEKPSIQRGVHVFSNGKLLANMKCIKQTNAFYLEGVDLATTP